MKLISRIIALLAILSLFSCGRFAPEKDARVEDESVSGEESECAATEDGRFGSIVINSRGEVTDADCSEATTQSAALYEEE